MPRLNNSQVTRSTQTKPERRSPMSDHQPTSSMTLLRRLITRESAEKANDIFENFSLSKFPEDSLPSNYVPPRNGRIPLHHAEQIKRVQDFQNRKIVDRLHKLKAAAHVPDKPDKGANKGVTVVVPKDKIAQNFPRFDRGKETIVLEDVMKLVAKHTRGTEFHVNGDPTLNRLALLARVNKMRKGLGFDRHGEWKGERR